MDRGGLVNRVDGGEALLSPGKHHPACLSYPAGTVAA